MEGQTPRSFGRGVRRVVVQPARLNYDQRGIPSTVPGAIVHRPQGEPADAMAAASSIQYRRPPPRSVISVQSSTSTCIRQNKLETKKKIAALEEEIEEKKEELHLAKDKLTSAEDVRRSLSQRAPNERRDEQLEAIDGEIRTSKLEVSRLEAQLARLEKSFNRRKDLILEEDDIRNDDLLEQNNVDELTPEDTDFKTSRVDEWVNNSQVGREDPPQDNNHQYQDPGDQQQAQPLSVQNQDSVSQLATAITQAISQVRVQPPSMRHHEDLPIFNGNAEDWPLFVAEFERTSRKYHLEDSEKIIRIRKALKGKAMETVHHLLANTANVPVILETLRQRFGQAKSVLNALAQKAKSVPSPDRKKPETIIEFGIAIQALVTNIESFGQQAYLQSVDLLDALVRKLPADLSSDWYEWLYADVSREENLKSFSLWMEKELMIAYRRAEPCVERDSKSDRRNRHVGVTAGKEGKSQKSDDKKIPYCVKCGVEGHHIRECSYFADLKIDAKMAMVKEKGLCYGCLRTGHRTKECKSKQKCGKSGCTSNHHAMLHDNAKKTAAPAETPVLPVEENFEAGSATSTHHGNVNQSTGDDLLWYIPVKIRGPNGERSCYAMIDNGAQLSLLDEQLAKELGLNGSKEPLHIGVFNGKESKVDSMKVCLEVAGDYANAKFHAMKNVRTLNNLDLPAQSVDIVKLSQRYPALKAAPLRSQDKAKPLLIIGSDYWRLGYPREKVESSPTSPAAIKTTLGWLLVGSEGRSVSSKRGFFHLSSQQEQELNQIVKEFICQDNFGVKELPTVRSKEDIKAMEILEATTKRVGDRWETGLLWRNQNQEIPESRAAALTRLYGIERKADRDPEFAKIYTTRFAEYIEKGYLEPVVSSPPGEKKWILPHFFAYHPSKKPRLVYDAASKSNGKSFNDFFLTGPDLLQSLPSVLLRFRRHKIGVIGNIREMFHQVKLKEQDQPMQTILYRGMDRKRQPTEYKMTVLFFGSVCSPASAIYVKDRNAGEFKKEHPSAVNAIIHDTYMDDFLSGADTEVEALKLQRVVTEINQGGGFPVAKWCSSNLNVLNSIPEDLRAEGTRSITAKSELPIEKTLGLQWSPADDAFSFSLNMRKLPVEVRTRSRSPTKREMASFIMSLFDPLGFLTPMKILGLLVFQATWREGIDWNDEIPESLEKKWTQWLEVLQQGKDVTIPRCIRPMAEENSRYELHTFCDASQEAYVAVSYLRVTTGENVEIAFLAGKGRVAPMKGLSVPRMELQAALIGARLANTITTSFGEDLSISRKVYWSDSRTVLCWLRSQSGRFSSYVNNRVTEILNLTDVEQWRWVPTKKNVADDATRSELKFEFTSNCRWLRGTPFLTEPEEFWPKETDLQEPVNQDDLELMKTVMTVTVPEKILPLPTAENHSSWYNLVKKTATWMASLRAILKKERRRITVADMEKADIFWCKKVQMDSFPEELRLLKKGETVDKKSLLYKLSPTLSPEGLIVLQSRIERAPNVSDSVKNPIILDPKHRYTRLLIRWKHIMNAHQGQETIINELRKRYWIVECRTAVKSMITKCFE